MTHGDKHEPEPKPDLLELWAGDPAEPPAPQPSGLHWLVQTLLAVVALAVILLLAKYAIDILAIVVGLGAVAVVLHVVGERVVRSNFLTRGWLLPTAMAVGVGLFVAYPFIAPEGASSLERFVPQPVVEFFDWSESHGWGQRAVYTQPGPAPARAPRSSSPARSAASEASAGSEGAAVSLTTSSPTATAGKRIVFTARLGPGVNASEVAFYDGDTKIGAGTVITAGSERVAYLQVSTLKPGVHDITVVLPGGFGGSTRRSAPVRVTVR
jgi:hypothetical protein